MIRSILIACAVVGLAACGGDDDGGDDTGGTPDAATGGPDAAAPAVEVVACPASVAQTVGTQGLAFTNATISIKAGEIIKFSPSGQHDMQSTSDVAWDSGALAAEACLKFNVVGTYPYKCSAHASMVGTVTVTAN